jgi:hypothetical protein
VSPHCSPLTSEDGTFGTVVKPVRTSSTTSRARGVAEWARERRRAAPPGRWRRRGKRGLCAPGASAKATPSRVRTLPGAAADAGRPSPLPPDEWWPAVTQHPAPPCESGWPSSEQGILSPCQITVKGAPAARPLLRNGRPLNSDLARQVLGTYRKDGAERGWRPRTALVHPPRGRALMTAPTVRTSEVPRTRFLRAVDSKREWGCGARPRWSRYAATSPLRAYATR